MWNGSSLPFRNLHITMLTTSLLLLLGAFALGLILTKTMIRFAPNLGLIDAPGERRIHSNPIPRAGGIAVWLSFLVVGTLFITLGGDLGEQHKSWYLSFIGASFFLLCVGIIDDRFGMNSWLKLFCQAVAASILFFSKSQEVGSILGQEVHWMIDWAIWVGWSVVLINAFNLIDGLDGLCGGLSIISLASVAFIGFIVGRGADAIIILPMIGAILGFMRYNFHPAKIFLGDAGSMTIGFFIASVSLVSLGERFTVTSLLLPILVAGIPLIDVCLAIWRRSFRSRLAQYGIGNSAKVFGPDQHHLHHRLLASGLTQRKVAVILYAAAILIAVLMMLPSIFDQRAIGFTAAALLVIGILGIRYVAPVELDISGSLLRIVIRRPAKSKLILFALTTYDILALAGATVLAIHLELQGLWKNFNFEKQVPTGVVTLAIGLLALSASRAYSRRWARASLKDFISFNLYLLAGMVFAGTINIVISDYAFGTIRSQGLILATSAILLSIPRAIPSLIRECVIDSEHRKLALVDTQKTPTLLYGAGDLGELFLQHIKITENASLQSIRIVGFIDDMKDHKGRLMDGFRIRGGLESLPALKDRWGIEKIIVTASNLSRENTVTLETMSAELGIELCYWNPNLNLQFSIPQETLAACNQA